MTEAPDCPRCGLPIYEEDGPHDCVVALKEELDEERASHAWNDKKYMEAAEAIRRDPGWPSNCWPSQNERVWYRVAQERIAHLESLLALTRLTEKVR